MHPTMPALLALALALGACVPAAGPEGSPAVSPASAGLGLKVLANVRTQIREETIVAAFGADEIVELLGELPAEVDPVSEAVFCVALGERPTGGYGITIQSAALVDRELRIRARETLPPPGQPVIQVITYPVGCASLRRAALPVGELPVRADDTRSDEFITSAVIDVPPADAAP
jgi:hypothetical protein